VWDKYHNLEERKNTYNLEERKNSPMKVTHQFSKRITHLPVFVFRKKFFNQHLKKKKKKKKCDFVMSVLFFLVKIHEVRCL
jgi:ADP-glucose pyrophosphorylase